MRHRTWSSALAVLLLGALALALGACGSSDNSTSSSSTTSATTTSTPAGGAGAGKPAVTIGDKNFPEELILGQLYAQALRAKGYTVKLKENIGSSEITDKALTSGQIDLYPEYTGTILSELAHQTKAPTDAQDAYDAAKQFEETRGFTLLDKTPFFDSDALAVTSKYAAANNLSEIADLKPLGKKPRIGALPEFATRFTGLVGLKQEYGVVPTFKPLGNSGLTYTALDSGQIDAGDVFTTDPQLQGPKYKLLKDPKFIFGFQNVAPVVSQKTLTAQGADFAATLNKVSALLTLPAVQKMNAAVILDKQSPADVAKQFLTANSLV
ncbi:MAG TPA: glycine betaine ABC transporter substrate-binding protein [Solirubrobacteraceae bacterium]|nr:glycine betaine ABC transporter substrate-binding protein [Solirubrobacteraceae bacterium]